MQTATCLFVIVLSVTMVICGNHMTFDQFASHYKKKYANNNERNSRKAIYNENLKDIDRLNALGSSGQFGVNEFTDLSSDEFVKYHTGHVSGSSARKNKGKNNGKNKGHKNKHGKHKRQTVTSFGTSKERLYL